MDLVKQIAAIKAVIKPNIEFIAVKEYPNGEVHARKYLKKNKADVLQFGWSEYKEPEAPKAATKKTTTRTKTDK